MRVDTLIVDAQPRRIDARTQRNVRQVPGDGEQPTRALEGCLPVACVPRGARAAPEPRVGVPAVQRHHEGCARVACGPHSRQGPGRLMLVNDVRVPGGDRAAHLAQASCLRGHAKREGSSERAGRGFVMGIVTAGSVMRAAQRESPPIELRHREGVREREVGRGNQQGSLRQGDPHEFHPRVGVDR